MDVLSDVIAVMRTGEPRSARVEWPAPWAQEFAAVPGAAGLQVVLSGTCWLTRPGRDPIELAAGDVVFRPHGDGHTLADSPSTVPDEPACDPDDPRFAARYANRTVAHPAAVVLCGGYRLAPGRAHPLLTGLPDLIHLPRLGLRPELRATVDLLAGELERPRLGTDAIVPALLDTLLLHILRTWIDRAPGERTGWAAALNDPPIAAALRAVHDAPGRAWTVAALAAEARMSRSPFARRFTELLGQPPLTYLTWWRMTLAARLLTTTDAPLGAVATAIGYGSEFAFAAAFKRRFGTPPGRYRRAGGANRSSIARTSAASVFAPNSSAPGPIAAPDASGPATTGSKPSVSTSSATAATDPGSSPAIAIALRPGDPAGRAPSSRS
ncbi:AraC-like DNA-binding protein [Actinoplanes octamycinicus]|uniref:AraC-like DNA-binding protein n=1 Tax=Actinoplanes octamycinicus TaxID=135948 RepID=A0A7W7H002_9ACTN|nr:AraC-like DNA-binding protein [Actinoplanes octamycinicus]GIE62800.1 AraC family transcriptional regulator [Actinoplanes octamycinicus]